MVTPGSSFGQTMKGMNPQCYIPSFVEIGLLVPGYRNPQCYIPSFVEISLLVPGYNFFLKGFYHIWAWRPSWSCDPDATNFVPPTHRGSTQNLALIGQAILEKKMFEHCRRQSHNARPLVYYKLTYEPSAQGSGGLIRH